MFWFIPVILGSLFAGGAAGLVTGLVISLFLDDDTIRDEIHSIDEFKNAIKGVIKSKSTRTVKVNIFGQAETELGSVELTSEKGISDNIYVGKVIYL